MARNSDYEKYLPAQPKVETRSVQADVPLDIRDAAEEIKDKRGLTWDQLITGLLTKLIDDHNKK